MSLKDFTKSMKEGKKINFMEGRQKGDLEELLNKNVTVNNFAFLKNEGGEYAVFTVAEINDKFFFGGNVITDNLKQIEAEGLKEELEHEGLPVKIKVSLSKNKRKYYSFEFYPEF